MVGPFRQQFEQRAQFLVIPILRCNCCVSAGIMLELVGAVEACWKISCSA